MGLLIVGYYLLFAALAVKRLNWAVLLVIAALPSYLIRFHVGSVPITLLEGMILVAILIWGIKKFSIHNSQFSINFQIKNFQNRALNIPLLLLFLSATMSMFVAPDLRAAAGIWKAYFIEPVLFFLVLRDLLHVKKLNTAQIIFAFSITALLLSVYAIYQRFTGFGIPPPWDVELRVTSIFPYPNALGLFLAPLVLLFVARVFTTCKLLTISYWLIVIIVSILAIIFAKSTGALVGIAVGLLFLIYFLMRVKTHDREFSPAKKCCMLHVICYVVTIALFITILLSLPQIRNELLLKDWSGHVRRTQWAETITMLKDRPILGAGLTGYQQTLAPYHQATYLEIFEYPHNIILNFWSETGLLGLLAFLWLIIIFFYTTMQSGHNPSHPPLNLRGGATNTPPLKVRGGRGSYETIKIATMASMAVLLVHGLVDVPYFKNDLAILFWIIFALGLTNTEKFESIDQLNT